MSARSQRPLVEGGAALLLIACAIGPLGALLAHVDGAALAPLGSARTYALLGRSLALAAAVTALSLAIGVPLATLFAQRRSSLTSALLALHSTPMFLPPFLLGLGWFYLLGRSGHIGSAASARLLFSPVGCALVLALTFAPLVTTLATLGMRQVDGALYEAARVVAAPRAVIWRVLVPAAWPSIAAAALMVFALSLGEMALPSLLRVSVYPSAVFARLGGVTRAPGEAAALSLPLLAVAVALLWTERRLLWRDGRAFDVLGNARAPASLLAPRPTLGAALALALAAAASLAPLLSLAARARWAGMWTWLGPSLRNSVVVSAASATVICALGLVVGHAAARGRRSGRALDGAALLSFFAPAAALGVGVSALYSRPATAAIYGSLLIVVLGLVGRYAFVGARVFGSAVAQSGPLAEQAAAVSGAGYLRRLLCIVAPMQRRGLALSWTSAAVFCLRDVETTILFYPPGGETLPVRIFTLEANGPQPLISALSLVHVALTLALVAGCALAFRAAGARGVR